MNELLRNEKGIHAAFVTKLAHRSTFCTLFDLMRSDNLFEGKGRE